MSGLGRHQLFCNVPLCRVVSVQPDFGFDFMSSPGINFAIHLLEIRSGARWFGD